MTQQPEAVTRSNGVPHPSDTFAGGGEMGARMRAIDWAATPLGPVEQWPQSLKTAIRIMLTSRQPIWLGWGPELIKLYNDPYKAIVGGKHPQALGQPASVVWREIWGDIEPMLHTAMGGVEGTYVESQLLIMERNGYPEETYYTFSYSPIPNDGGGIGGIICANTDDTERVIGERQLALLRELAARTADARTFADACARSAQGLATNPHDLPFALIYLAETEQRRFTLAGASGITAGDLAAPTSVQFNDDAPWPLAEVLVSHAPRLVAELETRFHRLPTGAWQRPPTQAVCFPIAPSGSSGKAGVLVVGLNPFRLFDERYQGFVSLVAGQIAASIANAQAYEEERRRAEALAELDRAKTAFFSNVSHEFRTPLTLMLGPTEELLAESELPQAAREQVALIQRNGQRLLRLVNTLLDFSRLEAGRIEAAFAPTDLATLTADLASVFRAAVERAGLTFVVDCPPLTEPVYVDRRLWEQVVFNLLSNALKFTFAGSITVAVRQEGQHAKLLVQDTGTGIPAEELPRLFERFHQVKGAKGRSIEGSGIGLALVQDLVRLHGGSVSVASTVGEGTTFTVALPLGRAHLPAEQVVAPQANIFPSSRGAAFVEEALRWLPEVADEGGAMRDAEAAVAPGSSLVPHASPLPRILLADDNADMRGYVERLLSKQYEVVAVADGEAALEAARAQPFELVLSDVMMPRLDGFGLLAALRTDQATRTLPVILLSARAGEEARVEGMQAGADDYLVKPFSARELLARVEANLKLQRLRYQAEQRLRANERRLQLAMTANRMVSWEWLPHEDRITTSSSFAEIYGLPALAGAAEGFAFVWHEDRATHLSKVQQIAAHGGEYVSEFRITRPDNGQLVWLEERATAFTDAAGMVEQMVGVTIDITERKRAEARQAFLLTFSDALRAEPDADAVASRALQMLSEQLQLDRCYIGVYRLAEDRAEFPHQVGNTQVPPLPQGGIRLSDFPEAFRIVFDRTLVIDNVAETDGMSDADRRNIGALGLRALVAATLRKGEHTPHWALVAVSSVPRRWTPSEIALLEEVAERLWAAMERARAEEALRESEEKYRALFNSMDEAYAVVEVLADEQGNWHDFRFLDANPAFMEHTAMPYPVGKTITQLLGTPNPRWVQHYGHVAETGESLRVEETEPLLERVFDLNVFRLGGPGSRQVAALFTNITARKEAEAERERLLRAAERARAEADFERRRLLAVLEQLPVGVHIAEVPGGRLVFDNAAVRAICGEAPLSADVEAYSQDYTGHYSAGHPRAGEPLASHEWPLARTLATGVPAAAELVEIRRADGTRRLASISATPVRDADGRMEGAVATSVDVTEMKRAEEALRESEARFRTVFEQAAVGVAQFDTASGRFLRVNQRYASIVGYTREELLAQSFQAITHPDDLEADLANMRRLVAGEIDEFQMEKRYLHKDGHDVWVQLTVSPMWAAGEPPNHHIAVVEDITARRLAEQRLATLQQVTASFVGAQTLAEVQRVVFDEVVVALGADAGAMRRIDGDSLIFDEYQRGAYTADADIERYRKVPLDAEHPAAEAVRSGAAVFFSRAEELIERYPSLAATIVSQRIQASVHLPLRRADEVFGVLSVQMATSRSWDAEERAFAIALADRAAVAYERARLFDREQELRKQAEEANRLKDEFLATVSHELRTPLTSLLGYGELLQRRKRDEAYVARTVTKMLQSAKTQAQLIEDLLDISRITSGKLRLEREPVSLLAVIEDAIDTVRPMLDAKNIRLQLDLRPEEGTMMGDPSRLQQVLWNLLTNAAKFTPAGGTVTVCLEHDGDHTQITVLDTGQGIAPEFLPFVFERFRQAEGTSTRSHNGLGLGLAIVRHLVELHGGSVSAASDGPGRGAAFTLRLPLNSDRTGIHTIDHSAPDDTEWPELRGLRVLIVEDQPAILELLDDMLTPYGVTTRLCGSAREALEEVAIWQPDLLLSDIAMPGEDGYWLIRNVRAREPEQGRAVPAVALTAYVRMEDRLRVLAAGFQQYVPKPVIPDELLHIVAHLARQARGRQTDD